MNLVIQLADYFRENAADNSIHPEKWFALPQPSPHGWGFDLYVLGPARKSSYLITQSRTI